VDPERCNGCGICLGLGCPAVGLGPDGKKTEIDQILCNSCGLCGQVCARQAIKAEPAAAGPAKVRPTKAEGGSKR